MLEFRSVLFKYISDSNHDLAIIDSDLSRYSYQELNIEIETAISHLSSNNIYSGSILVITADKSFRSLAYLLACIKTGIVYIPVPHKISQLGLNEIITISQSNAVLQPDFTLETISIKPTTTPVNCTCVLFTSGSTGTPKGVMISSEGLQAFVNWGLSEFNLTPRDCLVSYASYYFDLSTFDLFAGLAAGSTVWLINEAQKGNFRLIGESLIDIKPTVWYATPTVFNLLLTYGKLPNTYSPRLVLFAGEVFNVTELNRLRNQWSEAKFYNLYGPTETNVCTFHSLPTKIEEYRNTPYPIGKSCPFAKIRIAKNQELLVNSPTVTLGYLNNKIETKKKIIVENGKIWFKTGDQVKVVDDFLVYVGRFDGMVKRNGYRIELSEISLKYEKHPTISKCVAVTYEESRRLKIALFYTGIKIKTFDIKQHGLSLLEPFKLPDTFHFISNFPVNENGKIDLKKLKQYLSEDEIL